MAEIDLKDQTILTLVATVSDGSAVTWSSSDETKATVNENGEVTLIATGDVTITATSGDVSATCIITIKNTAITPEPDPKVVYDITPISAGGGKFGTYRKKVVAGDYGYDKWVLITNNNATIGYIKHAKYVDGTISFGFNSGSDTVPTNNDNASGKYYLCYMPTDKTKTYSLTYTEKIETAENCTTSNYTVKKNVYISADEPIYIYISNLASTGCTVTVSDIVITAAE